MLGKHALKSLILAGAAALLIALPASAQDKRVALVIGNGHYAHAPGLANPVDDAKAVSAAFRSVGLEVTEGYDLSEKDMRAALIRFSDSLAGAKGAVVFYAGHGVALDGVNYLLPVDVDLKSPADLDLSGISVDLILRQMRRDERVNVIILDACRNNPFAASLAKSTTRAVVATRGLSAIEGELARGALIAFSTDPGRAAFDGAPGQHSPFTAALLRHIGDPGASIETVLHKVREEVYAATDTQQLPWVNTSIVGDFALNPEAPAPSASAEALLWESAERGGTAQDYLAYLDAFPAGVFAPLARRRIEAQRTDPGAAEAALSPAERIAAQKALAALKLTSAAATATFDAGARAAIRLWQARDGLAATGYLDAEQLARLEADALPAPRAAAPVPPAKPVALVKPAPPAPPRRAKAAAPVADVANDPPEPRPARRRAHRAAPAATPEAPVAQAYDASQTLHRGGGGGSGGGGSGGGSGGGWSDARLKRDVCRVGTSASGLPIYTFRYLWEDAYYRGSMAQDLLRLRPEAVTQVGGYYRVDYRGLDVRFEKIDPASACRPV